jgi:hypothetical protein
VATGRIVEYKLGGNLRLESIKFDGSAGRTDNHVYVRSDQPQVHSNTIIEQCTFYDGQATLLVTDGPGDHHYRVKQCLRGAAPLGGQRCIDQEFP